MLVSPQVLLEVRSAATVSPSLRALWNNLDFECDEDSGLRTVIVEAGDTDRLLWEDTDKGKLLLAASDGELSFKLNSSSSDPILGDFVLIKSDDTTGITKLYVTNSSLTDDVTLSFYVTGNVTT